MSKTQFLELPLPQLFSIFEILKSHVFLVLMLVLLNIEWQIVKKYTK